MIAWPAPGERHRVLPKSGMRPLCSAGCQPRKEGWVFLLDLQPGEPGALLPQPMRHIAVEGDGIGMCQRLADDIATMERSWVGDCRQEQRCFGALLGAL